MLPVGNRRGPHCGITAIAVLAGVPFQTVWDIFAPSKPHNWKGSVTFEDIARAFRILKVRYRTRYFGRTINVRDFVATKAKPGVRYMVDTYDHLAVLKDGELLDQRGHWSLQQKGHWKIERVYEAREV